MFKAIEVDRRIQNWKKKNMENSDVASFSVGWNTLFGSKKHQTLFPTEIDREGSAIPYIGVPRRDDVNTKQIYIYINMTFYPAQGYLYFESYSECLHDTIVTNKYWQNEN